ncbi:circadian clock-controlled protein daywake-like [Zophobas morio]|uniref:circadian clock-controlled protein daywake-like n=1 Tax=Zophobas morio TaxID=2755281 RepID=UPI0030826EF2
MKHFILLVLSITLTTCSIPPDFRKCLRKDPNFKKCYFEAAQSGVRLLTKPYKSLDLPNIEPLYVPSLSIRDKGGAVAVDQNFKNCTLHGLTTIKFTHFELDLEKKTLVAGGKIPKLVFKCDYQVDGKLLLLPIKGEGNGTVTFSNFYSNYSSVYDEVVRNNKTYYTTASTKMHSDVEHAHFQIDNLFDGNKELGDNLNMVINDNWREVADDLKPEYNEVVRQILTGMMEKVWGKISLEEFFD